MYAFSPRFKQFENIGKPSFFKIFGKNMLPSGFTYVFPELKPVGASYMKAYLILKV